MRQKTFSDVVAERGASVMAGALNESVQTICNWRQRGVPVGKVRAVADYTGLSVKTLRPRDWQRYWPELERG